MKIHWGALGTALISLLTSGALVSIVPERYKPIIAALGTIATALAPSIIKSADPSPTQPGAGAGPNSV